MTQKLGVRRDGRTVNLIILQAGVAVPLTAKEARGIGETLVYLAGAAEMDGTQDDDNQEAALPVAA